MQVNKEREREEIHMGGGIIMGNSNFCMHNSFYMEIFG
jgi:hypothetical protein